MWWDDADITSMQSMGNSLDRCLSGAVIDTENLKKFMLMNKQRCITVVFCKHDISGQITKKIFFFHIRIPGFRAQFRYKKMMVRDQVTVQPKTIVMKSRRVIFFFKIHVFIKNFILVIMVKIISKFVSGKLHNFPQKIQSVTIVSYIINTELLSGELSIAFYLSKKKSVFYKKNHNWRKCKKEVK